MEKQDKSTQNWGGSRQGSGRKKTSCKRYMVNAPDDVAQVLENVTNRSAFIIEALRFYIAHHK